MSVPVHSDPSFTRSTGPSTAPEPDIARSGSGYEGRLAVTEDERAQAQRLRYEVFAGEWGATLAHTHLDVEAWTRGVTT